MTRILDLVASAIGLVLLSPLFAVVAIAIKLTSPGPVFHRATRIGRGGRPFLLYKFRSMKTGATGAGITRAGDPRITSAGRWLRKTKIDELPQLLNVLRGDMSLVGPRPEDPRYVALYDEEQKRILSVRPGMTSPASIAYRSEESELVGADWETTYVQQVMPAKLRLDLEYLEHRNVLTDAALILRTIVTVLRP